MTDSDSIIREAKTISASRSARLLTIMGIVAVIVSLVFLSVRLQNLRSLAEERADRAEQKTASLEATLKAANGAMIAGNLDDVRRHLRVATVETQDLAEDARRVANAPTAVAVPTATVITGTAPAPAAPPVAADQWEQMVFIQFSGGIDREAVRQLNADLRSRGWKNVQSSSGERVNSSIRVNEVRFHGDADAAAAEALAAAVAKSGVGAKKVGVKSVSIVRPGVLEVWISN